MLLFNKFINEKSYIAPPPNKAAKQQSLAAWRESI